MLTISNLWQNFPISMRISSVVIKLRLRYTKLTNRGIWPHQKKSSRPLCISSWGCRKNIMMSKCETSNKFLSYLIYYLMSTDVFSRYYSRDWFKKSGKDQKLTANKKIYNFWAIIMKLGQKGPSYGLIILTKFHVDCSKIVHFYQ